MPRLRKRVWHMWSLFGGGTNSDSNSGGLVRSPFNTQSNQPYPAADTNNNNLMTSKSGGGRPAAYPLRRVLIITKLSRYEFELRTHSDLTEEELQKKLEEDGVKFEEMRHNHQLHAEYLSNMEQECIKHGLSVKVVQTWEVCAELLSWADWIFTAGGDGTFLYGATKVQDPCKPVVGFCTFGTCQKDQCSLCLDSYIPKESFGSALDRIIAGNFQWKFRQRIRITSTGECAYQNPIEFKDHKLMHPECCWVKHRGKFCNSPASPAFTGLLNRIRGRRSPPPKGDALCTRVLKTLSLNEVYIGDSLSSRTSYYEISVDGSELIRQKSSGLTVSTGTGSRSWFLSGSRVQPQTVADLIRTVNAELGTSLPVDDSRLIETVCQNYNQRLTFDPSDLRMAYSVRDIVSNETFPAFNPRGFATTLNVKSRNSGNVLVIDGAVSYVFDHANEARLEILPQDALRTISFNTPAQICIQ